MHHSRLRRAAVAAAAVATTALGLVAVAGPANAATPSPSSTTASCDAHAWQSSVQGAPSLKAGDPGGDYLWHDKNGFHLRVTHMKGDRRVYTGVITASAPMRYTPVKLEKGDIVKLSDHDRVLSFSFVNYGRIDGANFHTDCASTLTLSRLHTGDADLAASRVYLGADKVHPARVPFTLHRAS
jgi:hypothetical protein